MLSCCMYCSIFRSIHITLVCIGLLAEQCTLRGYTVFSPFAHNHPTITPPPDTKLRRTIQQIGREDACLFGHLLYTFLICNGHFIPNDRTQGILWDHNAHSLKNYCFIQCPLQDAHEFLVFCLIKLKEERASISHLQLTCRCPVENMEFQLLSVYTCNR